MYVTDAVDTTYSGNIATSIRSPTFFILIHFDFVVIIDSTRCHDIYSYEMEKQRNRMDNFPPGKKLF
jgi:hypothetical protein